MLALFFSRIGDWKRILFIAAKGEDIPWLGIKNCRRAWFVNRDGFRISFLWGMGTKDVSGKNINFFDAPPQQSKLRYTWLTFRSLVEWNSGRWPICVLPLHATPRFFLIVDKRQSIRRSVEHRSQGYKVMSRNWNRRIVAVEFFHRASLPAANKVIKYFFLSLSLLPTSQLRPSIIERPSWLADWLTSTEQFSPKGHFFVHLLTRRLFKNNEERDS